MSQLESTIVAREVPPLFEAGEATMRVFRSKIIRGSGDFQRKGAKNEKRKKKKEKRKKKKKKNCRKFFERFSSKHRGTVPPYEIEIDIR